MNLDNYSNPSDSYKYLYIFDVFSESDDASACLRRAYVYCMLGTNFNVTMYGMSLLKGI